VEHLFSPTGRWGSLSVYEHLWDDLREKSFGNVVFDSLDVLKGHLEISLREMESDTKKVFSIVGWPWIIDSLLSQVPPAKPVA
jgi:hypothetical protein